MAGKKKRHKDLASPLPRIGHSLLPNAIFVAVPSTAKQLSETWPKKAETSHLASALGSVGNIAQIVAVGGSPRYDANNSDSESDSEEEIESEGHYAVVNENVLKNLSQNDDESHISGERNEEVIYATVNKRKKQQDVDEDHSESESENDITDVSGTCSDFEDSLSSDKEVTTSPKSHHKSRESRRRRRSSKTKKHFSKNISPEQVEEEPVIKSVIDENVSALDFPNGSMLNNLDNDESIKSDYNNNNVLDEQQIRDFYRPSEFEREHFNTTDLEHDYNTQSPSPPLILRTRGEVLGSSAPELTGVPESPPPEVPPVIIDRMTPVGKGQSSESIEEHKDYISREDISMHKPHSEIVESPKKAKNRKHHDLKMVVQQATSQKENMETNWRKVDEKIDQIQTLASSPQITSRLSKANTPQQNDMMHKTITSQQLTEKDQHTYGNQKDEEEYTTMKKKVKKKDKSRKQLADVVGQQIENTKQVNHENSFVEEQPSARKTRRREKNSDTTKISDQTPVAETKQHRTKHSEKRKKIPEIEDQSDVKVLNAPSQSSPLQQMSTIVAKETCRKLRQQVKALSQEKLALEGLSQSLNDENKTLKILTRSLTHKSEPMLDSSFSPLHFQNEELKNENEFLKDSVHRLNMELGRYQAKFRPLLPQEVDTMFESGSKQPSWLVNKKYLAPLLLAYDDRIKEKQDIIQAYEKELQTFKQRVGEIVQENLEQRKSLSKFQSLSHDNEECMQLEEQAKLVLQENAVLMERQEIQNQKMEEVKTLYKEEVSRLSKLYTASESEKGIFKSKLEAMTANLHELKQELENSTMEWKKRISVDQHLGIVNECQRKLEELKKQTEQEIESLKLQIQAMQKEKKTLTTQLADYKLSNAQLEREVYKFNEIQRKSERKTLLLKEKLDHIQERETTTQDTLSEVLKIAEKTSAERDVLNEMLASQQSEQKKAQLLVKHEEDKLKECKNKAYNKIAAIKGRVKEQERVAEKLRERYENEINNLRNLIRQQQKQLEDMVNDKRNLENELKNLSQNIGEDSILMNNITKTKPG